MVLKNLPPVLIFFLFFACLWHTVSRRGHLLQIVWLLLMAGIQCSGSFHLPLFILLTALLLLKNSHRTGAAFSGRELLHLLPLVPLVAIAYGAGLCDNVQLVNRVLLLTFFAILKVFPFNFSRDHLSFSLDQMIENAGFQLSYLLLAILNFPVAFTSPFFVQLVILNLIFNGLKLHNEVRFHYVLDLFIRTNLLMVALWLALPTSVPGLAHWAGLSPWMIAGLPLPSLLLFLGVFPRPIEDQNDLQVIFQLKGILRPFRVLLISFSFFSLAFTPFNPLFGAALSVAQHGLIRNRIGFGLVFLFTAVVSIFWCMNFMIINFLKIERASAETNC